ncbi:MAG TPA: ElyC/SanA/YdcF family protein [Verrucomicrobiae bacterium]|nr:ElyC/SanA/YdcF family protein [Verrucomicrobiae bacterium]
MPVQTVAIVLGVCPKDNQLPPQVHACLERAIDLFDNHEVNSIAVLGGMGHAAKHQSRPEAEMMKDFLILHGVAKQHIITRSTPVTTPEALWEVRSLRGPAARLITIPEKRERIAYLAQKIVGDILKLKVEAIDYILKPGDPDDIRHEEYLLYEAKAILGDMTPGDGETFKQRYSFKHHVWTSVVETLRAEGKL